MRRDRITNLAIVGVLAAIIAWVALHTYWTEVTIPTPLQGEAARNPYYSVQHLLGKLGIPSRRIGSLHGLPRNAVVLVDDLRDDLLHERIEALQSWVESGGRLIVSGDTLWSSAGLQSWSGISPSHRDSRPFSVTRPGPTRRRFQPEFNIEENCAPMSVRVNGTATGESLSVCAPVPEFAFASTRVPLWSLSDAQGMQLLSVSIGRGEFTVFGPRRILSNKTLLLRDHAEVLLDAARLKRGDELLILSPSTAEPLPMLLWRLAAPAIVFFGAALLALIWRELPRFGPPAPVPSPVRRSLAEQIRANARFAWRTRKLGALRAAVRRALDETAQRHIPGFGALNERRRASVLASRTGADEDAITAALTADAAGNVNVQRDAIARLEVSRRILDNSIPTTKRYRA